VCYVSLVRRYRKIANSDDSQEGDKRGEVTGEWRKLHNEKLQDLYSSPKIESDKLENEMGGACSADGGGERSVYGLGGET
jgi:poly(A) polymerase Pap1